MFVQDSGVLTMLDRRNFFADKTPKAQYEKIKRNFMKQLENTENRCIEFCNRKYDQERNFSVGYHPEIEANHDKIVSSKRLVLNDIQDIDKIECPAKRLESLIQYVRDLSELKFKLLFMEILVGKVRKHLLPLINKHYPSSTLGDEKVDELHRIPGKKS